MRINCNMTSLNVWNALVGGAQVRHLPLSLEALQSVAIGFAQPSILAETAGNVDGPGQGWQAGRAPCDGNGRNLEGASWSTCRRDGVRYAVVLGHSAAPFLRLQRDARHPRRQVVGDRRRSIQAVGRRSSAQSARGTRQALSVARMRSAGLMVRRTSSGALDRWRGHESRELRAPLQAASPDGP